MMINDYIHVYSILPASVSPSVVFGAKAPTTTLGDTHDLPHSVLLPSGPIKRPSQHSVAIWQLLSSSPSEEERGLRGGEGGRVGSTDAFSFSLSRGILYFFSSAHVTMCTYAPVETGHPHTYIHIHTYTHIYTYTYTCILPRTYTHVYIHTYIHMHIYPCIYTYIHPHAHTHAYTCICICTNCRGIRTSVLTYYIHIPNPPTSPPHPHTCTPPLSRFLTVRNTCTPFSCKNM